MSSHIMFLLGNKDKYQSIIIIYTILSVAIIDRAIFEKAEKDADAYLQQMDQILGQRLVPDEPVPPAQQQQYMNNQRTSCA